MTATRALVLGGGGPVGIAWESGLIAGLARGGVDLGQADFTLGTSAGSFVGARLALGADAATLADPILAEAPRPVASAGDGSARRPADMSKLMSLMAQAQGGLRNPAEVRAEIGAFALAAETINEAAFIATFGRGFAGLADGAWPARGFACTAVDSADGTFKMWTKASGVGVTRAVASSCSVPGVYPPITLGGRRYIDGGMRSATNADMAAGHDLVVVIALKLAGANDQISARLDDEVESLKEGGATVAVMTPDPASLDTFGGNLMDFSRRAGAARAGLAQGAEYAEALKELWG